MTATAAKPSAGKRGLVQRFTGKVGPLPVWAWALLILAAGYLIYRLTAGSSSTPTPTAAADTAGADTGAAGSDASGAGGVTAAGSSIDTGSLNDTLAGFGSSIDALTQEIQSSQAFSPGDGSSGSGSTVPNDGSPAPSYQGPPTPGPAPTPSVARPAARAPAPAVVRYYTYQPGKAPKGRANDAAPAKGPAGTTLRFAKGKGYYYA